MDEVTRLFRVAVAYPFEGDHATTRLLVGAGLHFLAGVVFTAAATAGGGLAATLVLAPAVLALLLGLVAYVPLAGYAAATARELLDGGEAPPAFDDWPGLLADGLRVAGIALLYGLPLVALGVAAFAATDPGGGVGPLLVVIAVLAVAYALAAAYVLPAAVVNVVHTGRASGAWAAGTLREATIDREYVAAWIVGAAILLVGGAIGAVLAVVAVGFAVLFAAQVAAVYAVTRGVIAALDIPTASEPPPPPASGYIPGWDEDERRRKRRRQLTSGVSEALLPTTSEEADGGELDRPDAPARSELDTREGASGDVDPGEDAPGSDIEPLDESGGDIERAEDDDEDDVEPSE